MSMECEIMDAAEVFKRVTHIGDVDDDTGNYAPVSPESIVELIEMKVPDGGAFWPMVDFILDEGVVPDLTLWGLGDKIVTSNGHHRLVAALLTGSMIKVHHPDCDKRTCALEPFRGDVWFFDRGDESASSLLLEGLRESLGQE